MYPVGCELQEVILKFSYPDVHLNRHISVVCCILLSIKHRKSRTEKVDFVKKALQELAEHISAAFLSDSKIAPSLYYYWHLDKSRFGYELEVRNGRTLFWDAYQILETFFTEPQKLDFKHLKQFLTEP